MKKKLCNKSLLAISMVLFIAMVVVNALSMQGVINGNSQKAISAMFPTTITPAGYAFSIWGIIYLLNLIGLIILFVKSKNELHSKIIKNTSVLFWISCVLNIAWTFAFAYKLIWLSAIFIFALLVSLLLILSKNQKANPNTKTIFDIAIGVYTGWLFVATLVNISAFFVSVKWDFLEVNKFVYAIIVIVAVLVAFLLDRSNKNPFFFLAIAWAYVAIMVAIGFAANYMALFVCLVVGAAILLILAGLGFRKLKFKL